MSRRKPSRLTDRDFIRALQLIRLNGLPSGEYEPMSSREEMYLRIIRAGHPVDIEDFVLSKPLFQLEAMERRAAGKKTPRPNPHDRC